jgi:hypothetical protein
VVSSFPDNVTHQVLLTGVYATATDTTVIDDQYPSTGTGKVEEIEVNLVVNGNSLKVGCGKLVGTTFKPRNVVTIDTTGDGTGVKTYTAANGDFTKFGIMRGDYLMAYSSSVTQLALIEPTPKGYGSVSGDQTGAASFTASLSTASSVQMQARGLRLEAGKINGQNLSDITKANSTYIVGHQRGEAGPGYGTNTTNLPTSTYTLVETTSPATASIIVDTIEVNVAVDGGTLQVGCGSLSGTTFTPSGYVEMAATKGTGQQTYTSANGDFESFVMPAGDYIYTLNADVLTRTERSSDGILEYGYILGDHMDDISFTITTTTGGRLQFKFSGLVI